MTIKSVLLNIPEKMLDDLDSECMDKGYNRTEYIKSAIREKLYKNELPQEKVKKNSTIPLNICQINSTHTFDRNIKGRLITFSIEGDVVYKNKYACKACIHNLEERGICQLM